MGPPPGMPAGLDSEQMRSMMQNPQMMQQMSDMMSNMDPAQMQSMARMAGAPGQAWLDLSLQIDMQGLDLLLDFIMQVG